jgi:hypothetical protein
MRAKYCGGQVFALYSQRAIEILSGLLRFESSVGFKVGNVRSPAAQLLD